MLGLKENGQCPKGLQVKSAPTGAELDLELYHRWEEAHITLSNTLRDILIEHWINTEAKFNLITTHTERLENSNGSTPVQDTTMNMNSTVFRII